MKPSGKSTITSKRLGILIGGSGLIGGALTHFYKTTSLNTEILAPSSKKLSLRVHDDIKQYFRHYRPSFIINAAIAPIDSNPQIAFETNYLGSVNLAKVALAMGIPYIHISTASTLPPGENLTEDDHLPLTSGLANYTKSKLMAELTLKHIGATQGLDYTIVRLALVYGEHDHKIQGFNRLLFSIANQSLPLMLTKKGVMHSYSNNLKLSHFIHYIMDRREEFSGKTYHFVDPEPVELTQLIFSIKSQLGVKTPRKIFVPYRLAQTGKACIRWIVKRMIRIGIEARVPAELMFLVNFYKSQTLSSKNLKDSSYKDPAPGVTVFTELPTMIEYYLTRWKHLNLLSVPGDEQKSHQNRTLEFQHSPTTLLDYLHNNNFTISKDDKNGNRRTFSIIDS
ncbi:MAG: NAD-dependent epimerase/dehydratase family protein [Proteobacteria bacterium]|nr:NAD-dependent epimerase/dehydratase family protein [Pseudomonadota bacterium]